MREHKGGSLYRGTPIWRVRCTCGSQAQIHAQDLSGAVQVLFRYSSGAVQLRFRSVSGAFQLRFRCVSGAFEVDVRFRCVSGASQMRFRCVSYAFQVGGAFATITIIIITIKPSEHLTPRAHENKDTHI